LQSRFTLEVCANSVQSAINAQIAGAHRVELCENLNLGGTTPSHGCIKKSRDLLKIKLNVLIRPRSGDFLYSTLEFEQIKEDIIIAKKLGADGIVCGILLPNGKVDIRRTKELVELSNPLSFTFHRAFDFSPDPFEALEDVIQTGATHLLTSGQKSKAVEGVELISNLVRQAKERIVMMPGSGISSATIHELIKTGASEFHMSGVKRVESKMAFQKNISLCENSSNDFTFMESNVERINEVVQILSSKTTPN